MVAITLLVLNSCETKNSSKISTNITISGKEILIYIIDSCEYIGTIKYSNSDILTHKGNCKFCLKRNK